MNPKYKYLIKNTGILTISNFSSKLLVFFLVPLYTGVLTPAEYGIYDLIVSTVSLLLPVLTLNIVDGVMRFSFDKNYSQSEVASVGFRYSFIGFILFTALIYINKTTQVFPQINGIEWLVIAYMFCQIFVHYFTQLAKGLEKVFAMGIAGIIGTLTAVTLNIYFLLYLKLGFHGFFLAGIISSLSQILYYSFKLKVWDFINLFCINKTLSKSMLIYSTPLIFTVLGWWVNSTADKYIVTLFCGIASNGLLAISYKIPTIINTVQSIFMQAWQISAIKEYENGDDFFKLMFDYYNLLMCITCSILIMLTRPLASFLFAKDFYQAWQYVPLLLVCSVLSGAAGFIGPILSAQKDSKTMAKSAVYGSITNVLLNFLLTYYYGIQGAVIATVISSYVMYIIRKKAIGNKIESAIYASSIVCWLLLIIQSFIEIYINNYLYQFLIFTSILVLLRQPMQKAISKICNRITTK